MSRNPRRHPLQELAAGVSSRPGGHMAPDAPRCLEPRCACQTSPNWRDPTPDEHAEQEDARRQRHVWPYDARPERHTHPPQCRARA